MKPRASAKVGDTALKRYRVLLLERIRNEIESRRAVPKSDVSQPGSQSCRLAAE